MSIAITSESTIDLTKELLDEYDIKIVPFSVILGEEVRLDGEITNQEIFDYVSQNKKLPKTSAVNEYQYEEFFEDILKTHDEIVHIAFSSELSSACRNAKNVAERYGGKIHVIDSKSLSTGIALLAIHARELEREGKSASEIESIVSSRVNEVQASFVLQHVDYLYKGGRCSKIAFLGANLFHICPQIIVKDGKMDAGKKYRGNYIDVCSNYFEDTLNQFKNPDLNHVFITYTSLEKEKEIINIAEEKLLKRGFKNIHITNARGTISSHCGPDCIGILYFNKNN